MAVAPALRELPPVRADLPSGRSGRLRLSSGLGATIPAVPFALDLVDDSEVTRPD
jgi:hypothetical protein